jgi:hypothetical protein
MKDEDWTNDRMVNTLLKHVFKRIHTPSEEELTYIRRMALDEDVALLRGALGGFGFSILFSLFSFMDGFETPDDWPGVTLMNSKTGEQLTEEHWAFLLTEVEQEVLEELEDT